jgi:hypothetical protein
MKGSLQVLWLVLSDDQTCCEQRIRIADVFLSQPRMRRAPPFFVDPASSKAASLPHPTVPMIATCMPIDLLVRNWHPSFYFRSDVRVAASTHEARHNGWAPVEAARSIGGSRIVFPQEFTANRWVGTPPNHTVARDHIARGGQEAEARARDYRDALKEGRLGTRIADARVARSEQGARVLRFHR